MTEKIAEYMDRTTPKPMEDVSLYQIEQGLADLIAYRQERMADKEDPPQQDELDAIENEIKKYEISAPAKVARVVGIFLKWRAQIANAKEQIKRYREIVRALEANEERLKQHCAGALEVLPAPAKGCRTLNGFDGSKLILKGNGGMAPLQVDGWDPEREEWDHASRVPLPDEYQVAYLVVPRDLANCLMNQYDAIGIERVRPNGELIRATLAEPCVACVNGEERSGACQCGESMDGYHDNHSPVEMVRRCETCGGTGKKLVPGARLLPRGSHVEVK